MEGRPGPVAHDEVDSAVDEIGSAAPGCGHTAGVRMVLKDVALVAIHLGKAAC